MDGDPITSCNITCNKISWNRLTAFSKLDQNIVDTFYSHTRLRLFLSNAANDFIKKGCGIFFFFGFRLNLSNNLQRRDFSVTNARNQIIHMFKTKMLHHLLHLFRFQECIKI